MIPARRNPHRKGKQPPRRNTSRVAKTKAFKVLKASSKTIQRGSTRRVVKFGVAKAPAPAAVVGGATGTITYPNSSLATKPRGILAKAAPSVDAVADAPVEVSERSLVVWKAPDDIAARITREFRAANPQMAYLWKDEE